MECYRSKHKLLGFLILTIIMVGGSTFCTTLPDSALRLIGWIGVVFFGLGFVVIPAMYLRKGPQVIINETGIEDFRLGVGMIRWDDIGSFSIDSVYSSRLLCIEVKNPQAYLSRMPIWKRALTKVNRSMGYSRFTISFSGLTPGLDDVWAFLKDQGIING